MQALLGFVVVTILLPAVAQTRPGYLRALPPEAQRCQICHFTRSGMEGPNAFGQDWKRYGSLQAILSRDSDGDGFSNGEELQAGTLPGDPRDYPGASRGIPFWWVGGGILLTVVGLGFWFQQRRKR